MTSRCRNYSQIQGGIEAKLEDLCHSMVYAKPGSLTALGVLVLHI